MTSSIITVIVENLNEIYQKGIKHPVIGDLFDIGTYGMIDEINTTEPYHQDFIVKKFEELCNYYNLSFEKVESFYDYEKSGVLLFKPITLMDFHGIKDTVYRNLEENEYILMIVIDSSQERESLFIFLSYNLPIMGSIGTCELNDIFHTWLKIFNINYKSGHNLLQEKVSSFSLKDEEELDNRLKQLYGE
ncbi:hypothetical protein [Chengkuizengella axinellae]|uniref:Uncharacterized protein n=1 Tax=Chengkuizengella axinellae TaxID=3064388 RepID=A0ABT9J867_9BACL|nr:hypothetical protein [Chengkuizengella sp. 2205SS18-9]MDP5277124.1 hypothetical protein [Chengkuizengella sp. 2205SS18-9]